MVVLLLSKGGRGGRRGRVVARRRQAAGRHTCRGGDDTAGEAVGGTVGFSLLGRDGLGAHHATVAVHRHEDVRTLVVDEGGEDGADEVGVIVERGSGRGGAV